MKNLQRLLLILSGSVSGLALAGCIISLASEAWITAEAVLTTGLTSQIRYGLFEGNLERSLLSSKLQFHLTVVCDFSVAGCMYSCQKEQFDRIEELKRIVRREPLEPCEQARVAVPRLIKQTPDNNTIQQPSNTTASAATSLQFIPSGLWLSAVLFHALSAAFGLAAFALTILNLYYSPVERIFNVCGLFVWNGCAALSALISLSVWSALFVGHLQQNVAITDTLRSELTFSSTDRAELGYSYYVFVASLLLSLLASGILLLRRQMDRRDDCPTTAPACQQRNSQQADVAFEFY